MHKTCPQMSSIHLKIVHNHWIPLLLTHVKGSSRIFFINLYLQFIDTQGSKYIVMCTVYTSDTMLKDSSRIFFINLYLQFIDTQGLKYIVMCTVQVTNQE